MFRYILLILASPVLADPPQIVDVQVRSQQVSVTILHGDTGWDHYADGWRIEDADGQVLGTRILAHPHVNEQPFTRSLQISDLPDLFYVRSRCIVDGWSQDRFMVQR